MMKQRASCFHYGWVVAFCGSLLVFYSIGLVVNSFSLFLNPLISALTLSKTSASSIAAVQNLGGMVMSFLAGILCRRIGARMVILLGGSFTVAGYFYLSTVSSLAGCYGGFFLVGCGYGMGGMIPASILISNWFAQRKGVALSIVSMASAFATMLYPKLISALLLHMDIFAVYRILSGNVLAIVLLAFLLVRDKPSDLGLLPYGLREAAALTEDRTETYPLRETLKNRSVQLSLAAAFLMGAIISTVSSHISMFYIGEGFSPTFAASMVSLFGIVMLVVKPVYGVLADRFPLEQTNIGLFFCMTAAMCVPFFFHVHGILPPLFVILYGLTSPFSAMTFSLWAEQLGQGCGGIDAVYPVFRGCYSLGAIVLLTLPGYIADRCGTYVPVFGFYIVFSIVSFILIQYALWLSRSTRPSKCV